MSKLKKKINNFLYYLDVIDFYFFYNKIDKPEEIYEIKDRVKNIVNIQGDDKIIAEIILCDKIICYYFKLIPNEVKELYKLDKKD